MIAAKDSPSKTNAVRIGDLILDASDSFKNPANTTGISDEAAGALLFLLELHRQTSIDKYLTAAKKELNHTINHCRREKTVNYSFLSGRMGIVYTLLQFYKATGEETYLTEATTLAKHCADEYLNHAYTSNFLFNGRSGTLLVLLHLHALTHEKWILTLINLFTKRILDQAKPGKQGIFWSSVNSEMNEQCGFGYGNSGIGLTLMEVGYYFQNKNYYILAEQAFKAEDARWNDALKNWANRDPELRNAHQFELAKANYKNGNFKFFDEPTDNLSLAHGITGMGLARLRAFELLKNDCYNNQIDYTLNKLNTCIQSTTPDTINSGYAGFGLFSLEAYRVTRNTDYLDFANKLATQQLSFINEKQFIQPGGLSLYNGISGIGYFLLQLHDPLHTPSVILPKLEKPVKPDIETDGYPIISLSTIEARQLLLHKRFPRTSYILEGLTPTTLASYFREDVESDDSKNFSTFAATEIEKLPTPYHDIVQRIFTLELEKNEMLKEMESASMTSIAEFFHMETVENLLNLEKAAIFNTMITIHPESKVLRTLCNPEFKTDFEFTEDVLREGLYTVVLKPTSQIFFVPETRKTAMEFIPPINTDRVREVHLNEIETMVINVFMTPLSVKEGIEKLLEDTPRLTKSAATDREQNLFDCIAFFLIIGILTPVQK
jgi:rhamnogalacturonyl hydrolase YesR